MSDKITMNYAASLILHDVVNEILYEKKDGMLVEREVPFGLKYKLGKNKAYLDKDYEDFYRIKLEIMAIYGDATKDGKDVEITDPEKRVKYEQAIQLLLAHPVEHVIDKVDPKDLQFFTEPLNIDYTALKYFQAYMCDEPELLKELTTHTQFELTLDIPEEETNNG